MTGRPPGEGARLVELSARLRLSVDSSCTTSSSSAYIAAISVFGAECEGHRLVESVTIQHSDGPPLISQTMSPTWKSVSNARCGDLAKSAIRLQVGSLIPHVVPDIAESLSIASKHGPRLT